MQNLILFKKSVLGIEPRLWRLGFFVYLNTMKIGKLQIVFFKNIKLGGDYGKPVYDFSIIKRRRGFDIHFFCWCLMVRTKYKSRFKSGKPISIQEFTAIMKKRGVDLSKAAAVEISVNGIKPIETVAKT